MERGKEIILLVNKVPNDQTNGDVAISHDEIETMPPFVEWKVNANTFVEEGNIIATSPSASMSNSNHEQKHITKSVSDNPKKIIRPKKRGRAAILAAAVKANKLQQAQDKSSTAATGIVNENDNASGKISTNIRKTGIGQYLPSMKSSASAISSSSKSNKIMKSSTSLATEQSTDENDNIILRAPMSGIIKIYSEFRKITKTENDDKKISWAIGNIEPCSHPTVIDNLCVICGKIINDNKEEKESSNFMNQPTLHHSDDINKSNGNKNKPLLLTVSGGLTVQINNLETRRQMANVTLQKVRSQKKLQLVLDLDHTLLHATADPRASYFHSNTQDCKTLLLPIYHSSPNRSDPNKNDNSNNDNTASMTTSILRHFVKLRPHICDLLLTVQQSFEISIYTAGTRSYAEHVANIISRHLINYQLKQKKDKMVNTFSCLEEEQLQQLYQAVQYAKERLQSLQQKLNHEQKTQISQPETSHNNRNETSAEKKSLDSQTIPLPDENEGQSTISQNIEDLQSIKSKNHPSNIMKKPDIVSLTNYNSEKDPNDNNVNKFTCLDKSTQNENNNIVQDENSYNSCSKKKKRCRGVLKMPISMGKRKEKEFENDHEDNDISPSPKRSKKRVSFASSPEIKFISSSFSLDRNWHPLLIQNNNNFSKNIQNNSIDALKKKVKDSEETMKQLTKELEMAQNLEDKAQQLRRQMFGSRIISRTDVGDLGRDVKSLQRVFPCGGKMAVIVDDREDVWANGLQSANGEPPPNLLVVQPYHWKPFLGFADVNNSAGEDITRDNNNRKNDNRLQQSQQQEQKINENEEENDLQLKWIKNVLVKLHNRYYSQNISENERDNLTVSSLLKQMRLEVLGQSHFENKDSSKTSPPVKIVFSGLVPLHQQQKNNQYKRPAVVRFAEDLGAKVLADVSSDVTHVVAARDGTDKIMKGRKLPNCAVVRASWLMECYWSMTKRDVMPHWLGTSPNKMKISPESIKNKEIKAPKNELLLVGSDESENDDDDNDDDDDNFAALFENDLMK